MCTAVALVGGQCVEREQRRDNADRLALAKLARDLEQPQFALRIEAVARLDLDRRAPAAHQRVKATAALFEQFHVARRLGFGDGRGDPATGFGDCFIGRAGAAHRMFVGARAAEDEMRVAVDQARRDPRTAQRIDLLGAISRELGTLSYPNDLAILDANRAVFDDTEVAALKGGDIAIDE
jgi:hypothetical protein